MLMPWGRGVQAHPRRKRWWTVSPFPMQPLEETWSLALQIAHSAFSPASCMGKTNGSKTR